MGRRAARGGSEVCLPQAEGAGQGRLLAIESVIHSSDSQLHPIAVENGQIWSSAVCLFPMQEVIFEHF